MTKSDAHDESKANGIPEKFASQDAGDVQRQANIKPPAARLKVIIRRLPPGLTPEEFNATLGPEWDLGQGKVDWAVFKPGKASKDPSKLSRPSRAYLHLTHESHLIHLSDAVRKTNFEDSQNTFNSQCLIGPPTVEFAPYGGTPTSKSRVDARAGTIDQDPEFMAFLEGIANPAKESIPEIQDEPNSKNEKITTTPLVQYLREKKAIKSKEVAAKSVKKQESQSLKGKNTKESTLSSEENKKVRENKTEKSSTKTAKEAVRILNREPASKPLPAQSNPPTLSSSEKISPKLDIAKIPLYRQRGVAIAAHIRMLQRDLGISPARSNQQVRREVLDSHLSEKEEIVDKTSPLTTQAPEPLPSPAQIVPTAPKGRLGTHNNNRRGRGKGHHPNDPDSGVSISALSSPSTPVVLLKKPDTPRTAQSIITANPTPPKKPTPVGPSQKSPLAIPPIQGPVQAFVKHANPSQGITEPLLREAMEKFGDVSRVEIDKRKGFAYVNFIDPESLKKAMAANPISIGLGAVQVMPRKGPAQAPEKKISHQTPIASSRNGRGGRGGNFGRRGGRTVSKSSSKNSSKMNLEHSKQIISPQDQLPPN